MAVVERSRNYYAMGVNHMEVGNHPQIGRVYNLVFDREDRLNVLCDLPV